MNSRYQLLNGVARRADKHGGCLIGGAERVLYSGPSCDFSGQHAGEFVTGAMGADEPYLDSLDQKFLARLRRAGKALAPRCNDCGSDTSGQADARRRERPQASRTTVTSVSCSASMALTTMTSTSCGRCGRQIASRRCVEDDPPSGRLHRLGGGDIGRVGHFVLQNKDALRAEQLRRPIHIRLSEGEIASGHDYRAIVALAVEDRHAHAAANVIRYLDEAVVDALTTEIFHQRAAEGIIGDRANH